MPAVAPRALCGVRLQGQKQSLSYHIGPEGSRELRVELLVGEDAVWGKEGCVWLPVLKDTSIFPQGPVGFKGATGHVILGNDHNMLSSLWDHVRDIMAFLQRNSFGGPQAVPSPASTFSTSYFPRLILKMPCLGTFA